MNEALKHGVYLDYHLCAPVKHRGDKVTSGHYTCQALASDNCWHTFDDDHVRREKSLSRFDLQAYLLFYKAAGASMESFSRACAQVNARQVESIIKSEATVTSKVDFSEVMKESRNKVLNDSYSKL